MALGPGLGEAGSSTTFSGGSGSGGKGGAGGAGGGCGGGGGWGGGGARGGWWVAPGGSDRALASPRTELGRASPTPFFSFVVRVRGYRWRIKTTGDLTSTTTFSPPGLIVQPAPDSHRPMSE